MQKITPFLWFDGNAEEAMHFYTSIFKNSRPGKVMRASAGGSWPQGALPAGFQNNAKENQTCDS